MMIHYIIILTKSTDSLEFDVGHSVRTYPVYMYVTHINIGLGHTKTAKGEYSEQI